MKQGIYEQSLAAKYPIGLRYREPGPMGRTFHYNKANASGITKVLIGVANDDELHEGKSYGAVTAGSKTITVEDETGTTLRANQYKDGLITIFTTNTQVLRIASNTANVGGYVTMTLKDPLLYDVANDTFCGWYPNIYGNVYTPWQAGAGWLTFVSVSLILVTANYHFWGQTYGFCHGIPSDGAFGTATNERDLYFHIDGALRLGQDAGVDTSSQQRAGYLLPKTSAGGGDQAYMLQLAP